MTCLINDLSCLVHRSSRLLFPMTSSNRSRVRSKKPKALKKKGLGLRAKSKHVEIVIDRKANLVFKNEKDLFEFFQPQIDFLEKEFDKFAAGESMEAEINAHPDFSIEDELELSLEEPQEIWHDPKTFTEFPIFHFLRPIEELDAFHVTITYVSSEDEPTFIFLHFFTKDLELVARYRRGELVYDRAFEEVGFGALDGDSLSEGDPLAMGLFISMLKVRGDKDIPHEDFPSMGEQFREETIESADEIWKHTDLAGNEIVTFIKEFPDVGIPELNYIAVTQEDPGTKVHSLLFSFPTNDPSLLDRYRQGENLQAEEVVQESSH